MTIEIVGFSPGIIRGDLLVEGGSSVGASHNAAGLWTLTWADGELNFPTNSFTKAKRWKGIYAITPRDWAGAVDSVNQIFFLHIGAGTTATIRRLALRRKSATKYSVALIDNSFAVVAESVAQFDWGVAAYLLAETDGTTMSIFWNDLTTPVLTEATAYNLGDNTQVGIYVNSGANSFDVQWPFQAQGDPGDARPNPANAGMLLKTPTSGAPIYDQYTGDEVNFPTGATSKWDSVDEWATAVADDDATWNEQPATASSTFRQTYKTTGGTLTKDVYCGIIFARYRGNIDNKSLQASIISASALSGVDEKTPVTLLMQAYVSHSYVRPYAPVNTPWSQAQIDSWEIGVRWDTGVQAISMRTTAVQGVIFGLGLGEAPPPPTGPDRVAGHLALGTRVIERPRPDPLLILRPDGAWLRELDDSRRALDKRLRE